LDVEDFEGGVGRGDKEAIRRFEHYSGLGTR
jgi:hypothetical protein